MVGVRGTADQAARPETWIPTWVRRCGMRFGVSWPLATGWLFDSADQNRDQADCPRQIMTSREHSPKSISGLTARPSRRPGLLNHPDRPRQGMRSS